MNNPFKIGDKVITIKKWGPDSKYEIGKVYTIASLHFIAEIGPAINFEELDWKSDINCFELYKSFIFDKNMEDLLNEK